MKLTVDQMFLITEACTLRAEQLLERSHLAATSKDATSADYWKQEAAAAHQLSLLFKDAIKVEITTAALEPAAMPLFWQDLQRVEITPAALEPATQAKEGVLPGVGTEEKSVLPAPTATAAEAAAIHEALSFPHVPLHQLDHLRHALAEAGPNGSLEGWAAEETAQASSESTDQSAPPSQPSEAPQQEPAAHPQSGSSTQSAAAENQPPQPRSYSQSSAHPAEPCGDINCDGHCRAAA